MKTIDPAVLAGYNTGIERDRLRTGIGIIEFERTKEILLEKLPKPPAVIYDVGGAYGEYSWWLASLGYEVHLFDLSETNINMSAELAAEYPGGCPRSGGGLRCPLGSPAGWQRRCGVTDGAAVLHYGI